MTSCNERINLQRSPRDVSNGASIGKSHLLLISNLLTPRGDQEIEADYCTVRNIKGRKKTRTKKQDACNNQNLLGGHLFSYAD